MEPRCRWGDGRTVHNELDLKPLGATVRRLRRERGMTQEALAGATELHANHVGGLERGERNVTMATLLRVAAALGVPPAALLEGYG